MADSKTPADPKGTAGAASEGGTSASRRSKRPAASGVWERFVRDGWTARAAAERMGVAEDYAAAEMARVRGRVQRAIIADGVARDLRSGWNPTAALHLH